MPRRERRTGVARAPVHISTPSFVPNTPSFVPNMEAMHSCSCYPRPYKILYPRPMLNTCACWLAQAEVEVRMWAAADEADRRSAAPAVAVAEGASGAEQAPAAAAPSAAVPTPGGAAAGFVKAEPGAAAGPGDGGALEEPRRPLAIMHSVLQEAAGRLALNEVRVFGCAEGSQGRWATGRWAALSPAAVCHLASQRLRRTRVPLASLPGCDPDDALGCGWPDPSVSGDLSPCGKAQPRLRRVVCLRGQPLTRESPVRPHAGRRLVPRGQCERGRPLGGPAALGALERAARGRAVRAPVALPAV